MEFATLIRDRFSVRNFKDEHLPDETVDAILQAGHVAPTGCNNQPQRILVLNTDESIAALRTCTKCHFHAPTAFLVCHEQQESWKRPYDGALSSPVDAAIVATHMMLAAHDLGVGCCWVMHFDPQAMKTAFRIPPTVEPLALLVMGIPSEEAVPLGMHAQTRPLTETVFYEHF